MCRNQTQCVAIVWGVLLMIWALPIFGDELPPAVLAKATSAYQTGHYAEAYATLSNLSELLGVVPLLDQPDNKQRAQVFFDLGRIFIASGDTVAANKVLNYVFVLDPQTRHGILDLTRDDAYDQTEQVLNRLRKQQRNIALQKTSFWGATGRSLVLPGWGQMYRGHKKKGYGFMGAAAALTLAWFVADRSYNSAFQAYRATTLDELQLDSRTGTGADPDPFLTRYEKAKSRAHLANFMVGALATVWAVNVLEHVVIGPAHVSVAFSIP